MKHAEKAIMQRVLGLLLMMGLAFSSGCDNASKEEKPAEAGLPAVGVLLYKDDDAYVSLVEASLRQELEGKAEFTIVSADNSQLNQDEQIRTMLGKGVSVLAVNLVSPQASASVLDIVKKAGASVVFFNREPDLRTLQGYDKACFVGTVAKDAGIIQGELIKDLWARHPEYDRNGDGSIGYLMFQGEPGNPEALARTEYSVRRARELGLNMRQVGETQVCMWDGNLAREAMRRAFVLYGDEIDLIIANNDEMALGALDALGEVGYNLADGDEAKFIPVVGVDATPQAREAIREGRMSATVEQDATGMGRVVTELLLNAAAGKPFLEGTGLAWDESGQAAIRIPYLPFSLAQ